jgi:hypothetical protein
MMITVGKLSFNHSKQRDPASGSAYSADGASNREKTDGPEVYDFTADAIRQRVHQLRYK